MTSTEIFIILIASGMIHASFQLSVSMITVMSGHALGKKTALSRLSQLAAAFALGAMTMVALGVSFLALLITNLFADLPAITWSIVSGLMMSIGVAVWLFYYRYDKPGTVLWIPRPIADYLSKRARSTKITPEAFTLGIASVVAESVFNLVPSLLTALLLVYLDPPLQLAGLLTYTLFATLPVIIITMKIGAGGSIAKIQRWRERNKRFMQFAGGSALILLGIYVYVQRIIVPISIGGGM